jgi:low affinity Fe/Cu permease
MRDGFNRAADALTRLLGSPFALATAAAVIVVWALTGPLAHFSDTWQLVINTGTTIVTFLMVFVIQNSQNRTTKALHLKLDELIRSLDDARNDFLTVEQATDEEMTQREEEMERTARSDSKPPRRRATTRARGRSSSSNGRKRASRQAAARS